MILTAFARRTIRDSTAINKPLSRIVVLDIRMRICLPGCMFLLMESNKQSCEKLFFTRHSRYVILTLAVIEYARLVKWSRRSPLTAESGVRLPYRVPTDEGSGDTSFFHASVEKT